MRDVNGVFDYKPDAWSSRMSSCWLRVFQVTDRIAIVIATELEKNPGPSVTNSAEAWATEAVKEYRLDPERTYFVEHYDHRGRERAADSLIPDESYDFIDFKWVDGRATAPKWRPAKKEEIEKLVGEELE